MLTGISHSRSIPVSYSLAANISNGSALNEGDSITYTLTTTGLPDGTIVYWDNAGSTVSADFNQGINSGTLTINNNTASITLTLYEDYVTEGTETIVFNVMETQGGAVEDTMTYNVNDTTITPGVFRVTVGHTDVLCHGALTGELRVDSATGGNPPYTYTFKQGSQVLQTGSATTLNGLAAGTYTIDVVDAPAGQYAAQTISQNEVILQPLSSISATHSSNTSSITVDPSGGTAGYTIYLFHHSGAPIAQQTTSGSAITFTGLSSNTGYEYSIVDSAGCSIPNRISVNTGATALSANIAKTNVTCAGGANGQITVNVSSGESPYSYTWNGTSAEGSTAYNLTQGTYSVMVTDNAGQQQSFPEIQITQPDPIGLALVSKTSTSITISAIGGNQNFTYSGAGQTNSDGIFTGLTPGQSYSFSVTDSNGCGGSTNLSAATNSQITAEVTTEWRGCNWMSNEGYAEVVNVSGGSGEYYYSWGTNALPSNSNSNSDIFPGNHIVIVEDANDSSNSRTFAYNISKNSEVEAAFIATQTSLTAYLSGGVGPYYYDIDDPNSTAPAPTQSGNVFTFSGLSNGTDYHMLFRDSYGCQKLTSRSTLWPELVYEGIVVSQDSTCNNQIGNITVSWSGGSQPLGRSDRYHAVELYKADGEFVQGSGRYVSGYSYTFTGLEPGTYYAQIYAHFNSTEINGLGLGLGTATISSYEPVTGTKQYGNPGGVYHDGVDYSAHVWAFIPHDTTGGEFPITVTIDGGSPKQLLGRLNETNVGNYTVDGILEYYQGLDYYQGQGKLAYWWVDNCETYIIEYVDANGCVYTPPNNSGHVSIPDIPLTTPNIGPDITLCSSNPIGVDIYLNASNGCPPYAYELERADLNDNNWQTISTDSLTQNITQEGRYRGKITDLYRTVYSNIKTITHTTPTLSFSSASSNSIVVNVNPGAVLHVNGGTIQTTSTPWTIGSLEPNTTYNITSTFNSCTSSTVSATTTCDTANIVFEITEPTCISGGVIKSTVNGVTNEKAPGYSYQWYKNGSVMSGRNDWFLSGSDIFAGNYMLEVTSPQNCTTESSIVTLSDRLPIDTTQTGSTTSSITIAVQGGGVSPYVVILEPDTPNAVTQALNGPGTVTFTGLSNLVSSYTWRVEDAGGCVTANQAAIKPTITLYSAYTTPNTLNPVYSSYCDYPGDLYTLSHIKVISDISIDVNGILGDYLRNSDGGIISFEPGERIAISPTYNSNVKLDNPMYQLTFGGGGVINSIDPIFCSGSSSGDNNPPRQPLDPPQE